MKKSVALLSVVGIALIAGLSTRASAGQALDVNFDSGTAGSPNSFNTVTPPVIVSPAPAYPTVVTHPQNVGNVPEPSGTEVDQPNYSTLDAIGETFNVVSSVAGMTNAIEIDNSAAASGTATNVAFLNQALSVPNDTGAHLSFDYAQLANPGGDNGGFTSDFLLVAYRSDGGVAFAIGDLHATPGEIYIQSSSGNTPIGTYILGDKVHVDVDLDYTGTGSFSVDLNNVLVASDQPFYTPYNAATPGIDGQINELFFQVVAGSGGANNVALDNIEYTLPEPASLVLLGLGGMCMIGRRRRNKN